jgi:hypothetical protein
MGATVDGVGRHRQEGSGSVRALALVVSLVVLAGVGAAGYVLVSGAHASTPTSYWCRTALDRAGVLDALQRQLGSVRVNALKARHRHQAGRYHRRSAKVRNLEARVAHARDAFVSKATLCRDGR